jgi:hypothetical protein
MKHVSLMLVISSSTQPFTIENHEPLLKELWVLLTHALCPPGSEAYVEDPTTTYSPVSETWTAFGFQQKDPVSDIRGGGVLCIHLLTYFLREHGAVAAAMMTTQQQTMTSRAAIATSGISKAYPFAAAGINVTRVLCQAFSLIGAAGNQNRGFREEKRTLWLLTEEFNELFCVV